MLAPRSDGGARRGVAGQLAGGNSAAISDCFTIYIWMVLGVHLCGLVREGAGDQSLHCGIIECYDEHETCACWLLAQHEAKIGGQGLIVEVDETSFSKRKSNMGRVLSQQWVLGGLCRETGQCFLVAVDDRSAATLLAAIADHVETGSTIYTDCWTGYSSQQLQVAGFQHFTVNHSYNFVDPFTGVHTQNIERMWGCLKWRNKRHRGTKRDFLQDYFIEFMCRRRMGDDPFCWIMQAIASCFPPDKVLMDAP